jgi:hypothetical protein
MGDLLIRATAILAVAGFAGRMLIDAAGLRSGRWQRLARAIWSMGCATLLIHVICAFQFQHGWSHAAAWEHTRQRTRELTGWNSGAGIYANELMAMTWLIDVVGWWASLEWPRRHRTWYWFVQTLFVFMMVNATAVFGPRYWILVAGAWAFAVIACCLYVRGQT